MLKSSVGIFSIRFTTGGDLYPGEINILFQRSDTPYIKNEAAVAYENEEGGRGKLSSNP